jgi:hypothetical protein
VFASVVEDVAKLLARGDVSRSDASRWLTAEDLAALERTVVVSSWYDIRSYDRMNQLLLEIEGGGRPEYLRGRGRETARRLLDAGFYSQMEYLQRTQVTRETEQGARIAAFGRDLRLLSSLSASILNFSRWTARIDANHADRYVIEVSEATDFPETLCWRSDGFINEMAARHSGGDLWDWVRPARDRVLFCMLRPV